MRTTARRLMIAATLSVAVACSWPPELPADPLPAVRAAVDAKDLVRASQIVDDTRAERGTTPAVVDAMSLLALALKTSGEVKRADETARTVYDLSYKLLLAGRGVDDEPRVPLALGRAIEIMAQAQVRSGATATALAFLRDELRTHRGTSIEKRIQRNINLIELEGTHAPALDVSEYLGARPPALSALKGQVVILFFWAHYCADCKAQAPVLARVVEKYRADGLAIVAPTQRYGYVAEGKDAAPDIETRYIEEIRRSYYPVLAAAPIPLSDANHRQYGVSSTPTIVLLNRDGRVALYHPGTMTESELDTELRPLLFGESRPS